MSNDDMADEELTVPVVPTKRIRFAPIEYSNKTYDSILLREPTVGDLIEMRKQTDLIAQMAVLIGKVAKVAPQLVYQLPKSVLEAASAYFEGFSEPSPPTGTV
jgi:hypothetical protein